MERLQMDKKFSLYLRLDTLSQSVYGLASEFRPPPHDRAKEPIRATISAVPSVKTTSAAMASGATVSTDWTR